MPCFKIRFGWQYSAELLECYLKLSLIIVRNSVELCFDSIIIVADVIDMWDIYHVHHDCHLNSAYKYETTPSSWGTNLRKEADVNEQPLSYSDTKAQRREITVYNPIHYTFFLRMCATKVVRHHRINLTLRYHIFETILGEQHWRLLWMCSQGGHEQQLVSKSGGLGQFQRWDVFCQWRQSVLHVFWARPCSCS